MRRAVFDLVLWPLLAGLACGASASARPHARASAAHGAAARAEACADLPRSRRKACEARRDTRANAPRAADACAKLPRRRRATCEREVEAASRAEVQAAVRPPSRRAPSAERALAASPSAKRELQPEDLVGGVEPAREGAGAPALRGSLSADVAVPTAAGRSAARGGRATAHLQEVVLEDGQSLADLAARTGVSVADLARLNGVASPEDVPTGMRLKLPRGARAVAPRLAEAPPTALQPPAAAPVRAAAAPVLAVDEPSIARGSRAERRVSGTRSASESGPRPYASLGPEGATPATAPPTVRGGRTQADALAAYAVASARAPRLADRPEATHERFVWPLRSEVVSGFGAHGLGRRNDGVDLAARPGDAVRAAAAGEVVYAGKEIAAAGGNLVLLKHADGWVTAYSHLGRLAVGMRQTVEQGQEIAESTDVAGASVHFEVREPSAGGAKPVDPASVLPARSGADTGRG